MRLAVRAAGGILFAARHGYHFHPVELPDQPPPGTITLLLERSRKGEAAARDDLYRHIERDLRAMARRQLAGAPADPLMQATMLVNEACERLLERHASIQDRRHLFFLLSRAMHDVLVEHVRRQVSIKRGGGARRVPLTALDLVDGGAGDAGEREVAALREALDALAEVDPDGAEMIRLRFYCGRSLEAASEIMGVSFAVGRRHWEYARAWLHQRLSGGEPQDSGAGGGAGCGG